MNLKSHLKYTHGGIGKFECLEQSCGKRFKMLSLLTKHKNSVHRRLKPWKCEVDGCGVAFSRKGNLRKHFKRFHEEGAEKKKDFRGDQLC